MKKSRENTIDGVKQTTIISEVFRTIRTNILYSKVYRNLQSILFTSAEPGEGKSLITRNTAIALAQTGKKVIVLDCDLRKPTQHALFRKHNKGLTSFLYQGCSLADIVQDTDIPNLRLVTSGPTPRNPAELLDSGRLTEVIAALKCQADYVLVDSPPVLPVTDACILGSKVDGILLVVGIGRVKPEMAQRAKEQLEDANGNILGLIINRSESTKQRAYYHYYETFAKTAN